MEDVTSNERMEEQAGKRIDEQVDEEKEEQGETIESKEEKEIKKKLKKERMDRFVGPRKNYLSWDEYFMSGKSENVN